MIRPMTVALMLAAFPAFAQEGEQRFVATPNGSGVGVWIVDTQTGEAKFCWPASDSSAPRGYVANCTEPTQ